ncbi:MAG: sulfite exporter TauE/SafE family protein [Ignavibacteriales bacterium]|nr:sulfite exporter TauE/SafE family protein [Ignavibacteriales bacterium]
MELFFIVITACGVSILTFFSGFGLGTLLMPVFALFFPLQYAIAATAVVHLLNNIYKATLMGKYAERKILLQFGLPSAIAAFAGAFVLTMLSESTTLFTYTLFAKSFAISIIKIVIALLMIVFALFEILPVLQKIQFNKKYLPAGGLLSGFFGGLSGHQGALRTAFLMRLGLDKKQLIGTLVLIAVLVDISRLSVYFNAFTGHQSTILENTQLRYAVMTGCIGALAGTTVGKQIFEKTTIKTIQIAVTVMLLLIAVLLGAGII